MRELVTRVAALREHRAAMGMLSKMSDRDLADMALARSQIHHVFHPEFAQEQAQQAAGDPNEQMLADLGLSRLLPRPTAGD